MNASVMQGITGATAACAGTPASTSLPSAASRFAGALALGSSRLESLGSRVVTEMPTATSRRRASSLSTSRSRSTRSDFVVIVIG
jgi:hypothetical protein